MKKLVGFGILCLCLLLGTIIKTFVNFPIPEAVYGMAILLIFLLIGLVKLGNIKDTCDLVLENLAFLFVIPGVALVEKLDVLKDILLPIIILVVVSTTITMVVTSKTVEFLQKRREK